MAKRDLPDISVISCNDIAHFFDRPLESVIEEVKLTSGITGDMYADKHFIVKDNGLFVTLEGFMTINSIHRSFNPEKVIEFLKAEIPYSIFSADSLSSSSSERITDWLLGEGKDDEMIPCNSLYLYLNPSLVYEEWVKGINTSVLNDAGLVSVTTHNNVQYFPKRTAQLIACTEPTRQGISLLCHIIDTFNSPEEDEELSIN